MQRSPRVRHLVCVLGDQLDADSAAFDGFDAAHDAIWMAEVAGEAEYVWSHKARIALFLSAMRHYRDAQRARARTVHYRAMDERGNRGTLEEEFAAAIRRHRPEQVVLVEPGEHRVRQTFLDTAGALNCDLDLRPDRHFLSTPAEFAAHARGRKQVRLEYFYRAMRRTHGILVKGGKPVGGKWNFDADNRGAFGRDGPGELPDPIRFRRDDVTRQVLALVEARFAGHPGSLDHFDWPVTPRQARQALADFIEHRLRWFGEYQDAMWAGTPFLYHSRLSAALNLKLLDPRDAIGAAVAAYRAKHAPLNAVEGFVRQILGWREYVRGVYWLYMPGYLLRNELDAHAPLPGFYWTGETEMACLRDTIRQTLDHGYAHHIQRLMVTGLFALLLGVDPQAVHRWYLAVYVDAVEWVELPNVLGMSQFADGGIMASKPYVATGRYIQRMSNYCAGCRYRPDRATGDEACPFTTLYWDFLDRHGETLASNPRMSLQIRNVRRKPADERAAIRANARRLRKAYANS